MVSEQEQETVLFNTCELLAARGENEAAGLLAALNFRLVLASYDDDRYDYSALSTYAPLGLYEDLGKAAQEGELANTFFEVASTVSEIIASTQPKVGFVVCDLDRHLPPQDWRADLASTIAVLKSNQALFTFPDSPKMIHEGLSFRSKTEIRVYNALVKKELLVFPLPVAVMGKSRQYKEPDFVVCYKGKTGILEIHGDKWHPPETAAREHERRREFAHLGISIFEIYDASRCWDNPDGVVDDFLRAFDIR